VTALPSRSEEASSTASWEGTVSVYAWLGTDWVIGSEALAHSLTITQGGMAVE
jgi:hypothetical protein